MTFCITKLDLSCSPGILKHEKSRVIPLRSPRRSPTALLTESTIVNSVATKNPAHHPHRRTPRAALHPCSFTLPVTDTFHQDQVLFLLLQKSFAHIK